MSEFSSRRNHYEQPVVIFDLDGTLVHDRPDEMTGRLWDLAVERGVIHATDEERERIDLLRTQYGHESGPARREYLDPLIRTFDSHIYHKNVLAIRALSRELVEIDREKHLLYTEVLDEAHEWKERGATTVIISGSPDFAIQPFVRMHNFDFGTGTHYRCNGKIYRPQPPVSRASEKHVVAEKMLATVGKQLGKSAYLAAAYGDTVNDLSLLEAAEHPVAINPKNGLEVIANERGYRTIIPGNALNRAV